MNKGLHDLVTKCCTVRALVFGTYNNAIKNFQASFNRIVINCLRQVLEAGRPAIYAVLQIIHLEQPSSLIINFHQLFHLRLS